MSNALNALVQIVVTNLTIRAVETVIISRPAFTMPEVPAFYVDSYGESHRFCDCGSSFVADCNYGDEDTCTACCACICCAEARDDHYEDQMEDIRAKYLNTVRVYKAPGFRSVSADYGDE